MSCWWPVLISGLDSAQELNLHLSIAVSAGFEPIVRVHQPALTPTNQRNSLVRYHPSSLKGFQEFPCFLMHRRYFPAAIANPMQMHLANG